MNPRGVLFVFLFVAARIALPPAFAQVNAAAKGYGNDEADQQISDFSLSGYGEKGKKAWDVSGKSAEIVTDMVKLDNVIGNLYGEEEQVHLTADKGDFYKTDGRMHLESNVVITTASGAKLTADSLDWDRKNQLVSTPDKVNIYKENLTAVAQGAKGQPGLKKVALEKDVHMHINPTDKEPNSSKEKIIITCDGPAEVDYEKNLAVFHNNVKVERADATIYSDRMEVYFAISKQNSQEQKSQEEANLLTASKIDKIVCRGNVKIVRGENISYSDEATYSAQDKRIILSGKPRLIIYSTEELGENAPSGN
ncbi:MAG: LPS export ABC transporter periplasmic protein LptC [Candidatus Omnitrophica bacterium]|nr:LPS export ABC transporter periplasmic protein LptC [Candidatus Omnitrophota bacterium]